MTERLYYHDSYLRRFAARAEPVEPRRVYLDRTAFYPTSGGQPHDVGFIGGVAVTDVVEEDSRIAHQLAAPLEAGSHECEIDWGRRFDHMQQHTGQHLLSAVLIEMFGVPTISFHMGAEYATIEIETKALDRNDLARAERRANEIVTENRGVNVSFHESQEDLALRKASHREGTLRVVTIEGLDRSACGATHVHSTGEIGAILLRSTEKIRGNLRLEFVCGLRAVRRARADFDALSDVAKTLSTGVDVAGAAATGMLERLTQSEKSRQKLELELAKVRGRELAVSTPPNAKGFRVYLKRLAGGIGDEIRAEAQAFTASGGAIYIAASDAPHSILLAVSDDSPLKAGATLKPVLEANGGRGGGSPRMAQGSVPERDGSEIVVEVLKRSFE